MLAIIWSARIQEARKPFMVATRFQRRFAVLTLSHTLYHECHDVVMTLSKVVVLFKEYPSPRDFKRSKSTVLIMTGTIIGTDNRPRTSTLSGVSYHSRHINVKTFYSHVPEKLCMTRLSALIK